MLQSFVAPVIILAASVWIDSNCFFESEEQLSHTESLYLSRGGIWFKHILFDQSLLHRYNIKEVGSDSKPAVRLILVIS